MDQLYECESNSRRFRRKAQKYFQVEIVARQRPYTLWVLNSNSLTQSNGFENHADKLLNTLIPKQSIINTFIEQKDDFEEIITFIYLPFDSDEKNFGFGTTSEYF